MPKTIEDARFDRDSMSIEPSIIGIVLRAYCLALVKACDFVHARVASEYYYEVSVPDIYRYPINTDDLTTIRKRTSLRSYTTGLSFQLSIHLISIACWTKRYLGWKSKKT